MKPRDRQKASWQAQVAFYLSIATALFSAFQWWNNQNEVRINAAMEISKNYAKPYEASTVEAVDLAIAGSKLDAAKATALYQMALEYDYVAQLANAGRIDIDFLSQKVKCGIWLADLAVKGATRTGVTFDPPLDQLPRLSTRFDPLCKSGLERRVRRTQSN
ncbi:MAG: hypothetical protein WCE79_08060 [Xanthobacteraceae bacterium]